jgi:hypothetical protein
MPIAAIDQGIAATIQLLIFADPHMQAKMNWRPSPDAQFARIASVFQEGGDDSGQTRSRLKPIAPKPPKYAPELSHESLRKRTGNRPDLQRAIYRDADDVILELRE